MYEVCVQTRFNASHQIRLYNGEYEPLHGHDWKVEAIFRGAALDEIEVLVDFLVVEQALQAVLGPLEHANLNECPLLEGHNPTAERVARVIFDRLADQLDPDCPLAAVRVEEAPGCIAGYYRQT